MSAPVVVWVVVGLVTTVAMAAVLAGLVRHVLLLGRTAGRFRREVGDLAREVGEEAARAAGRSPGRVRRGRGR
ncbi:MAG TPA: hypothetical protein VNO17_00150 [Actinomycetota bacterium]|nr:hypothetical protein [Actinomycetota bacterium]